MLSGLFQREEGLPFADHSLEHEKAKEKGLKYGLTNSYSRDDVLANSGILGSSGNLDNYGRGHWMVYGGNVSTAERSSKANRTSTTPTCYFEGLSSRPRQGLMDISSR